MDKKTQQDSSQKSAVKQNPLPKESGGDKQNKDHEKTPLKADNKKSGNKYGSSK